MTTRQSSSINTLLWCAALMLCGVAGAALLHHYAGSRWLLYRQRALAEMSDQELQTAMRDLSRFEEKGIEVQVAALGHPEQQVAGAALLTLHEQLPQWRRLDPKDSSPLVVHLVSSLREHVDSFPAHGQLAAAELVEQVLDWPLEESQVDRFNFLTQSDYILRASSEVARRSPWLVEEMLSQHLGGARLTAAERAELTPPAEPSVEPELPRPAELPVAVPPVSVGGHQVEPSRTAGVSILDPPEFNQSPQGRSVAIVPEVASNLGQPPVETAPSEFDRPQSNALLRPETTTPASRGLDLLSDIEVMRRLHHTESGHATDAASELIRRGYPTKELTIAKAATHPDPNLRRELADALPQAVGVDAFGWLLLLAQDPDGSVREVALAVLRSSGDPRVERELRNLQSGESIRAATRRSLRSRQ